MLNTVGAVVGMPAKFGMSRESCRAEAMTMETTFSSKAMMDPKFRERLAIRLARAAQELAAVRHELGRVAKDQYDCGRSLVDFERKAFEVIDLQAEDRKSTRLNSSHLGISYA